MKTSKFGKARRELKVSTSETFAGLCRKARKFNQASWSYCQVSMSKKIFVDVFRHSREFDFSYAASSV